MKLCTDFPGLDPIRLLDYPLADVIDLIREHMDHTRRAQQHPQNIQRPTPGGGQTTKVIRRPADDSWF